MKAAFGASSRTKKHGLHGDAPAEPPCGRDDAAREEEFELTQSNNETIRLQALREILDRLLGKPPVAIDAAHTKLDIGQLYLAALKRANGVVDGGLNGSVDAEQ